MRRLARVAGNQAAEAIIGGLTVFGISAAQAVAAYAAAKAAKDANSQPEGLRRARRVEYLRSAAPDPAVKWSAMVGAILIAALVVAIIFWVAT